MLLKSAELIDRFGKLPREVNTLMLVVRIKAMCKRAGIAKLDAGPKGATIQFHNDKFASPRGLVDFVHAQNGTAKIKDNKIVVRRDWDKERDKTLSNGCARETNRVGKFITIR